MDMLDTTPSPTSGAAHPLQPDIRVPPHTRLPTELMADIFLDLYHNWPLLSLDLDLPSIAVASSGLPSSAPSEATAPYWQGYRRRLPPVAAQRRKWRDRNMDVGLMEARRRLQVTGTIQGVCCAWRNIVYGTPELCTYNLVQFDGLGEERSGKGTEQAREGEQDDVSGVSEEEPIDHEDDLDGQEDPYSDIIDGALARFSRSRILPIEVDITVKDRDLAEDLITSHLNQLLVPVAHRLKALRIRFYGPKVLSIFDTLPEFPVLETFSMTSLHTGGTNISYSTSLSFFTSSPNLKNLSLRGCYAGGLLDDVGPSFPWSSLTHLHLEDHLRIPSTLAVEALRLCANLVSATLYFSGDIAGPNPILNNFNHIRLEHLQFLCVHIHNTNFSPFLDLFALPSLLSVQVVADAPQPTLFQALLALHRREPYLLRTLEIYGCSELDANVLIGFLAHVPSLRTLGVHIVEPCAWQAEIVRWLRGEVIQLVPHLRELALRVVDAERAGVHELVMNRARDWGGVGLDGGEGEEEEAEEEEEEEEEDEYYYGQKKDKPLKHFQMTGLAEMPEALEVEFLRKWRRRKGCHVYWNTDLCPVCGEKVFLA